MISCNKLNINVKTLLISYYKTQKIICQLEKFKKLKYVFYFDLILINQVS